MSISDYQVIEQVEGVFPLVDIPMMSDERWQQLAAEGAVKHFREWYGREPETVQEALDAQRALIERLDREPEAEGEDREDAGN